MLKNLSRKTKIILISLHLGLIIILGFVGFRVVISANEYKTDLEIAYQRSVSDVAENLSKAENVLNKLDYVTTNTGLMSVSAQLRDFSSSAKTAISYLPFSENNSEKVEDSLSLISDFALYLEKKSSSNLELNNEDSQMFKALKEHTKLILEEFYDIQTKLENGNYGIDGTEDLINKTFYLANLPNFDNNFEQLNQNLDSISEVNYDGVYSAHISNQEPSFLAGETEIVKSDAIRIASEFLECDEKDLVVSGETSGNMPVLQITGVDSIVRVTKFGGHIEYMKKVNESKNSKLSKDQAIEKAKEYLGKSGYENLVESYYTSSGNNCRIDFIVKENNISIYTDLVSVEIELENGEVVEFESTGYLMNHKEREIANPKISEDEARSNLSDKLEVLSMNLAIVPSDGNSEILAYEFIAQDKETEQELKIFINAETGLEEKIYISHKSENSYSLS